MTFLLSQERIISELEELTQPHEFLRERINKRRIDYLSTVDSIRQFQQDLLDDDDQISNGQTHRKKKYFHIPTYSIASNEDLLETTSITDVQLELVKKILLQSIMDREIEIPTDALNLQKKLSSIYGREFESILNEVEKTKYSNTDSDFTAPSNSSSASIVPSACATIIALIKELTHDHGLFLIEDFQLVREQRMILYVNRNRLMEYIFTVDRRLRKLAVAYPFVMDVLNRMQALKANRPKETSRHQVVKTKRKEGDEAEVEDILRKPSFRERQMQKLGSEILQILDAPTAKENRALMKFKSSEGSRIKEYCPLLTKEDCIKQSTTCDKIHFKRVIMPHTDTSMGDCSYLDTCRHMKTCKFIHYEIDQTEHKDLIAASGVVSTVKPKPFAELLEPQWIRCDVRSLDMTLLGKFAVLMADPPWDIHMNLPYGTLSDDEMRNLNVKCLQDDGLMFLWVTGRSMELGRECLQIWGYERVEEIVWIKTNQLQRIIRTGRTGHWLNHSKEHCLVGIKGNPQLNRFIDCDVVVAEVRETSRKPDEVYGMIERLSPGTRKLELFGRQHNVHPGWVTLGNQLDGVHVLEPFLQEKLKNYDPTSQDLNNKCYWLTIKTVLICFSTARAELSTLVGFSTARAVLG